MEAGRQLGAKLQSYANRQDVVVMAIPRGGVPIGFQVAAALGARLDVFILRKLGVPWQEELAFGAIASGHVRVLNTEVVEATGLSELDIERVTAVEKRELDRRERLYRGDRPPVDVKGMSVILVDDGIATGSSMKAAIAALRQMNPARLVVAVPVAPLLTCQRLRHEVDEFLCLRQPEDFYAVGQFYDDFTPVSDEEVIELLGRSAALALHKAPQNT
ncbi:MAG TPA: phosphoribosyltransferase [Candidatus Acidoferrales bacterium]|nr:phosphoribosyltransferase [Candidatus Acidoferrales bacterium]